MQLQRNWTIQDRKQKMYVYINPMKKFNETGIKTRFLGTQWLGREYYHGGKKSLQFFATLHCNVWSIFSGFANICEEKKILIFSFHIWQILIIFRICIGLPYNKEAPFRSIFFFKRYEMCCGHQNMLPYPLII